MENQVVETSHLLLFTTYVRKNADEMPFWESTIPPILLYAVTNKCLSESPKKSIFSLTLVLTWNIDNFRVFSIKVLRDRVSWSNVLSQLYKVPKRLPLLYYKHKHISIQTSARIFIFFAFWIHMTIGCWLNNLHRAFTHNRPFAKQHNSRFSH